MLSRFRIILVGIILTVYVMSVSGCAVAWFLAGAGAAATVAAVSSENERQGFKD